MKPRETTVPDVEFEAVFRVAPAMTQIVMLLAREGGLRHAAILNFSASCCDFEKRTIVGHTKGGASYNVPMTQRLYERLLFVCARIRDARESVLAQFNRGGRNPAYNTISTGLFKAKRAAGITSPWGLHDLRRIEQLASFTSSEDAHRNSLSYVADELLDFANTAETWQ